MIRILKYEEGRKEPLKCVVSIVIPKWGDFVIEGIKVFADGDKKWFHFPSKVYITPTGGTGYFKYNRFLESKMHDEFHHLLFEVLEEYLKNRSNELLNECDKI